MREIDASIITDEVKRLCIEANYSLPNDVYQKINTSKEEEISNNAKQTLDVILENANIALKRERPICQDTGMACIFCEVGQDVHINGNLTDAINEGVRLGYVEGYLRKSVVKDPVLNRENTMDNTPAIIQYDIVSGDKIKLIVAPKGFGSENMCQVKMMKPSDGIEGVKDFILKVVEDAGPNPCPPIVVGVGIGGNFDKVTSLAKKAMLKDLNEVNSDPKYEAIEKEMTDKINALGIGPAGFGGKTTCLGVHIETYPTHIAGMPVAVSICCHVSRHKEVIL